MSTFCHCCHVRVQEIVEENLGGFKGVYESKSFTNIEWLCLDSELQTPKANFFKELQP